MTVGSLLDPVLAAFETHKDRTAVIDQSGESVTYAELDARSRLHAAYLATQGVVHGDRVGVLRPKSIDTIATFIGAMRLGAAFVPVDASAPRIRNEFIMEDCAVRCICTDEVQLDANVDSGVGEQLKNDSGDLAYILYTSGSTGMPKGVPLTHLNASSFVAWCIETLQPRPGDVFSSHASFHFDLSVLDVWVPLWTGGTIAIVPDDVGQDPRRLPGFIQDRRITNWYSVPSILGLMVEFGSLEKHDLGCLRTICFAGEVFPLPVLRRLRNALPDVRLLNLYGPTETNVCTWYEVPATIPEERTEAIPIGSACAHCDVALFDDDGLRITEHEKVGRILAHGASVMSGYWGRDPADTGGLFTIEGETWYDTGDLGEYDQDGMILFRGRRDRMVKRHGYRIELGEIEAGLSRHPEIQDSAAWALESDGRVQIHAAIVPRGATAPGVIQLKIHCAAELPSWMSPDRFHVVEELPRTSTGKVDYVTLRSL